jgi:excinuclease ABC subunit A
MHSLPNQSSIRVKGVRVNNLKNVDLEIPHGQFVTLCGVSGSGKTSLALDTLYAEGQRRYVESFSPYTRQFLEQLDKPEADLIEGVPPAIAVRATRSTPSRRNTVGSVTEINEHLRVVFARVGVAFCPKCGEAIEQDSPQSAAAKLAELGDRIRFQVAFAIPDAGDESLLLWMNRYGFVRAIVEGVTLNVESISEDQSVTPETWVVVDRLTGATALNRIRGSLETAFELGGGSCFAMLAGENSDTTRSVDGKDWAIRVFHQQLRCRKCYEELPNPEPSIFNFNSALGACRDCDGAGCHTKLDPFKVIPNGRLSLNEGAIVFWNATKYAELQAEFFAFLQDKAVDLDKPFRELSEAEKASVWIGDTQSGVEGVAAFFGGLLSKKTSSNRGDFLEKWYSPEVCERCGGSRLNLHALAFRVGGMNIAEVSRLGLDDLAQFLRSLSLEAWQTRVVERTLSQVTQRLDYLREVGVGYLSLERPIRTLSSGEAQRVMLTNSLGSTLVNMLYVLDEPASGLHPDDVSQLLTSIARLNERGNTVVCVEHHSAVIGAADRIIEIGPEAGEEGGQVVFDGGRDELQSTESSLTGQYLVGEVGLELPEERREGRGKMKLVGASGNNLKNLDVVFPLGCLCVVSGVSGSGKSSLVQHTLYPALARKQEKSSLPALPYKEMLGDNQVNEVVLIDQSPIGRSPRSNPMTYVKAFDDVRKLFAEQLSAQAKGFTAGHFSFNVAKGRCPKCEGDGHLAIDMQFLSDVYIKCDSCRGSRFKSEVLSVKYRGKNIAEVLEMPIGKAFSFFRGQPKIQSKLKTLMDVGLGYLPLGQPATTLSTGEAQRLKLALYLDAKTSRRCVFIMDEPTAGLHMSDIDNLIETFDALIAVGHSLIVVEHNLQLMEQADWIIDLGPGAGAAGGNIVAEGTPESLAKNEASRTGYHLNQALCSYE